MRRKDLLKAGEYYLITNHSNGGEKVFVNDLDYGRFGKKVRDYMNGHWTLLAWTLLPDSYYLVVRIKEVEDPAATWEEINSSIVGSYSHFSNGFAKWKNKRYSRKGSLFAREFVRIHLRDHEEVIRTIVNIHQSPKDLHLCNDERDWKFSSLGKPEQFSSDDVRLELLQLFGGEENYIQLHRMKFLPLAA